MCRNFAGQDPASHASETRSLRVNGHPTSIRLERAFRDGDPSGHSAFAIDDLDGGHAPFRDAGSEPRDVEEAHRHGALMVRFFFVRDPDGYRIGVSQKHGRYRWGARPRTGRKQGRQENQ